MQISVDLSVYRQTLAYAIGNLIIMTIISSGLIIVQEIAGSNWVLLLFWGILSIGAVAIHVYVYRHVFRRVRLGLPVITYPVLLTIGYGINVIMNDFFSVYFLWYPLIGLSSLIVGLTAEQKHFSSNKLFSRPLLIFGVVMVTTSPVVFVVLELLPGVQENVIVAGIALIIAAICSSYSMAQAEKKVVNK